MYRSMISTRSVTRFFDDLSCSYIFFLLWLNSYVVSAHWQNIEGRNVFSHSSDDYLSKWVSFFLPRKPYALRLCS